MNLKYILDVNIENCPTNLIFYSDEQFNDILEATRSGTGNDGDPKVAELEKMRIVDKDENGVFDETIYWKWEFETTPGETISQADLIDSQDIGKTITAAIKVTGFEILDDIGELTGKTAEVNGVRYDTLAEAINAVPKDNTETTVKLLKNTEENIKISKNKNIVLDMRNHTISVTTGAIVENEGTLKIMNGTLTSSSTADSAINNKSTGKLTISGGKVMMTAEGGKQALYNDKGTVLITGDAYLFSASKKSNNLRATVQNQSGGTMTITGGTIVSQYYQAVNNLGTLTIGTKDGNADRTTPVLQGETIAVNSTTDYKLYDGILKGKTNVTNDVSKIVEMETGYELAQSEEVISGETYKTAFLAQTNTVTFNANGGTLSENTKKVESGTAIGTLPTPTRTGYLFEGWFTAQNDGIKINENVIITNDVTYYAHWREIKIAEINGTLYDSLQAAVNAVPQNNTETTIKLLYDTTEAITVKNNQNIKFDLQNNTITNKGNAAVIENNGTIEILSGNITSKADTATINNNSGGKLVVSGGRVTATGSRQAIYNNSGGIVEITGDAYLSSTTTGTPSGSTLDRATVHNLSGGTVTITGGTIVGTKQQAISNEGTLTIGTKDGNVNTSSPVIIGETCGLENVNIFNYYDGIIKGRTESITGTITEQESNTTVVNGTEVIDGKTYVTVQLQ